MASRIKLKRSTTPNSAPTTSDLTDKEVALNIVDRTLYVNNAGNITEVANADPNDEKIVPSMFSSSITDGVGNTWYVSTNGTDKATLGSVNPRHGETTGANAWGKTPTTAFASLKYCLDNYAQSGDLVVIAAGQYEETFPLTVPDGIAIKGAGLKSTFIRPSVSTNSEDAFLIEGNCNIEDLCVNDFYYDNVNDTGYAFRLASGYTVATDGRRPYIQRCSVITKGSTVTQADPRGYAAGDAGRGALVDGSIVDASSSEAALLFNECTFVVPNSVGLYLKNGARCEWLNSFTYFAADSIKGENPGGSGFKGAGKTRLKLNGTLGTFNATDTITYYDTDGTTVLASGTIDSNDGTYVYIDGQGTGQFVEAEADTTGKLVTAVGDAQLDTDIKYFGTASLLLDGSGDYLSLAGSSDFGFGTSDFTVETWIRPTTVTGTLHIYDSRSSAGDSAGRLYLDNGQVRYAVGGSDIVTSGGTTVSVNTWTHIAVVRNSSTTKIYVDGVERGSAADSSDLGSSRALYIGANFGGSNAFVGNIDEFRVSKGLARYTSTPFTVATSEFIVDTNTQLLLHFNGLDGSTDILDGSVSVQDIRSSSGGTAAYIGLADYTDFGAELRSIGSASVYGERGITADGKGVRLRCILHNFGYVGVGEDQSNDISNVNQANEIVETNGGRALFTSMDQNGDFRVGNAFFVDQENGTVSFVGGTSGGGTTFDQLIVTGTGNTTTILPTSITVGNLELSQNDIISSTGLLQTSPLNIGNLQFGVTGNSIIDTTTGNLFLSSNSGTTTVDDNLVVTGTTTLQGNLVTNQSITVASSNVTNLTASNATIDNLNVLDNASVYKDFTTYSTSFSGNANGIVDYPAGTYTDIALSGGSGQGAIADIVIAGGGVSNGSFAPLGGQSPGTYADISGTGGTGTGVVATIQVSTNQDVSSVTITSPGIGYTVNDVIEFDFGGSAAIAYTVSSVSASVESVTVTDFGTTPYTVGDVLSVSDGDIGAGGPYFQPLAYTVTAFETHVFIDASENSTLLKGTLESQGSAWLASTEENSFVAIGFPNDHNFGSQSTVDPDDAEKLEVNGNIRTQGDVKALGNIVASFGSVTQPSIKFDSDPISDALWNRTGFFGEYLENHGKINVVGDEGRIVRYSADRTDFYKPANFLSFTFEDPTIQVGSGYTLGEYQDVEVLGGSGSGLLLNLTVAFDGTITDAGAGYSDYEWPDIPLSYYVAPGGSVQTVNNLVGGSNYIDGTYTNVPLTGGTGNFATADITIASGAVTNVSIVTGGAGYTVTDTLSAETTDLGGSGVTAVSFNNNGSGYRDGTYLSASLANVSGSGTGATADIVVSGGAVTSVTIVDSGSGYTLLDQLTPDVTTFDSNGSFTFAVEDASSSTDYTFTGDATGGDPTITVNKGDDLTFNVNVPGSGLTDNAFYIVSDLQNGSYSSIFNVQGVNNNGATVGSITWTPNTAGTFYYISANDSNRQGVIEVLETAIGSGCNISPSTLVTGSGFSVDVATVGASAGGTGARANITTQAGIVTDIVIINGGSGYSVLDQLTVNYTDLIAIDELGNTVTSVQPTTDFVYRIDDIGAVSVTSVSDQGSGYEEGDVITLPSSFRSSPVAEWNAEATYVVGELVSNNYNLYQVDVGGVSDIANPPVHTVGSVVSGEVTFTYIDQEYYYEIGAATSENTVILDPTEGSIDAKEIDITTDTGININNSLNITNSTIQKTTNGNLILSASDYVEVAGTSAFIVPAGDTSQRPALVSGDAGAIRFNTEESRFEGFNGSYFVSLGGVRDVDGNTYISAELNPGDDDNTLRFFNNGVQSMQVEQTKLSFQSVTDIITTNVSGITEWEAGAAATAPADPVNDPPVFVYYEYNVYSVTSSGTFDATTPPTHTTGTITNGTVDLLWVRFAYGELTFNNTDSNVAFLLDNLIVNNNAVRISGTSSTFGKIGTNSDGLILNFTAQETEFIKFGSTGTLEVNVNYDLGTQNYIQVLDKDLRKFDLRDTRTGSGVTSLNTSSGNSTTVSLFPYTESYSGKVMVEITDDSTTPRKQYSEISYLVKSDGSDILYTESNKIYTDVVLCNVEADLDGGNVSILITDVTGSTTLAYSIKVVSNTILA
jgi:hypothetical protein